MKILAAWILSTVLFITCLAAPVVAAPATQGDFALALAQILGFEATTADAATGMLKQLNVTPKGGWQSGAPVDMNTVSQLRGSLDTAVKTGKVKPAQAEGSIDAAMAAVGMTMPTIYQADFALVLAKYLGFEVENSADAIVALDGVGVAPQGGWKPEELMSASIARELEYSLDQAVLAGRLKDVIAANAVLASCDSLGVDCPSFEGVTQRATIIPWYAPVAGPPADPIYIERGGGDTKEGSPYRR